MCDVVITGMGVFSANCYDVNSFEQILKQGKSIVKYNADGPQKLIGNFVTNRDFQDAFKQKMVGLNAEERKAYKRVSLSAKASVLSGIEAWKSAMLDTYPNKPERIGVMIGGCNISNALVYQSLGDTGEHLETLHPMYASNFWDSSHIGVLSSLLPIQGFSTTVGGASASGNIAMLQACHLLNAGVLDICLVIGAMADFSPVETSSFVNIGAYGGRSFIGHPEQACRPFDERHEGFVLGQASACLVLESLDNALKRQVPVYGHLLGGSVLLDRTYLTDSNSENQLRTMQSALKESNINVEQIQYINTHGTSTPMGDVSELTAVGKLLGPQRKNVYINSTKSLVGHCMFSAGVIEAIATLIQMNGSFIHGMPNMEQPISAGFRFPHNEQPIEDREITYAISNSYGFSGINSTIVLQRAS